jgi:hypothetical protein
MSQCDLHSVTPRTDAVVEVECVGDDYSPLLEHARQLERELGGLQVRYELACNGRRAAESLPPSAPVPSDVPPHVPATREEVRADFHSRNDKNCSRPTAEQIEAFRKEHHIPGPDIEPWAVEENMVLEYLCANATPTELPSNGCIALTYGKLKAALKELLRLYDWRNEIGTIERDFNHDKKQVKTWLNQYGREKKQAWHVARDVLAWAGDIDALMLHERIQREAQMRAKSSTSSISQQAIHYAESFVEAEDEDRNAIKDVRVSIVMREVAKLASSATASASPLAYKLRAVLNEYGAFIKHQVIEDAMLDAATELDRIQLSEWHPRTEEPVVSGWQWLDYWTLDGMPGVIRFTVGDKMGTNSNVHSWRYRGDPPSRNDINCSHQEKTDG